MVRTVRYLAGTAGVRQFLDLGSAMPTPPSPHETAQGIIPDAHVVYVDKDPGVLDGPKPISTPEGRITFIEADVREVSRLLQRPELRDTLDLSQPVAVSMFALLHLLPDADGPYEIVRELLAALPAGSFLSITHPTADTDPDAERFGDVYRQNGLPFQFRNRAEVTRFFDTLQLLSPGVQLVHRWRPDSDELTKLTDKQVAIYGGLARKG
jgi:hypothetical protein